MFVVRPTVLLDLLADARPGVRRRPARHRRRSRRGSSELWPTLPRIAVDHAVAEPAAGAGRVAVVPASFGWDDVGDFDSLADAARATTPGRG